MLNPCLVPDDIKLVAEILETMSVEQWQPHTANWHTSTHKAARLILKLGETARINRLRLEADDISDHFASFTSDENDDAGAALLVVLFCLSNSTLERIISTFPDN